MLTRQTAGTLMQGAIGHILRFGLLHLSRHRLPKTSGRVRLPGLQDQVEIIRDRWGVPHIYARDSHDLVYAQGFVHAQDRLWQLDFQRRLASGRLAEILGEVALPADRWLRILGMQRVAEQEVGLLGDGERAELEAYAAGVNAGIDQGNLPIEFTLLRYHPEPWSPADTLVWAKMLSWMLSTNWETELLWAQLIARLGPQVAAELEPDYPARFPTILPVGLDYAAIGQRAQEAAAAARPFTGPPAHAGVGSNNWVLAGSRTASGAAMLANDMHLAMIIPAVWYENHLVLQRGPKGEDELNITGVVFPGVPGVVAGHNGHVAWGYTMAFADVQDLYVERLQRTDDGRVQYEFRGEWLEAKVHREEIRVKGGETVTEEVTTTHHGPIINALAPDLTSVEQPLALRWTSLDPENVLSALRGMNRARDCAGFREAVRDWTAAPQNVVYADTAGNIAYSLIGRVPIRTKGNGAVPVPGWTGEYEWLGYVPSEELPHLYNPPQGYIITANNRIAPDDYPYFISREYPSGDRAQRITELIEAREAIDVPYIRRMQFDQVSLADRIIAQYLGSLEVDDPALAAAVQMIRSWDGELSADSPAAGICQVFVREMLKLMLRDKLGDLTVRYMGLGPTPILAEKSSFPLRASDWLESQLVQPDSAWFNLGNGETRDEVMRQALRETLSSLQKRLGTPLDGAAGANGSPQGDHPWSWGRLHKLTYSHVLGSVKALASLFNRGPYAIGGDATTVWATGTGLDDLDSQAVIGPPFRFIVDLGDLRNSVGLLAPGQSGRPGSRHYDDQVSAWFTGDYHPMLYAREEVERAGIVRVELSPTVSR
jgi:penicillin amidase